LEAVVGSVGSVVIAPNDLANVVDAIDVRVVAPQNVDGGKAAASVYEAHSGMGPAIFIRTDNLASVNESCKHLNGI
jgi:hypothetical protein